MPNYLTIALLLLATPLLLTAATPSNVSTKSLPEPKDLPIQTTLPNPLTFLDGTPVKTPADWHKRREEIKTLFEHYVYGTMPPAPASVTAEQLSSTPILNNTATHRIIRLTFGPKKLSPQSSTLSTPSISIRLSLIVPNNASKKSPKPVALYLFRGDTLPKDDLWPDYDLIVSRGYIAACFANADVDADNADRRDGLHPLYPDYDFATLAAWAYGLQRCVDYLITQDFVAADKILITGHSRRGKAALLAAAYDERIALAAPSGSGCGGVALSRSSEKNPDAETVRIITQKFPYWFSPRFAEFADNPSKLPLDQHMLIALMAPRPVMSSEGLADLWANPQGTQEAFLAALPVYKLLDPKTDPLGKSVGLRFREGGHDITRDDWAAILDFADQSLLNKKVDGKFNTLPFPRNVNP